MPAIIRLLIALLIALAGAFTTLALLRKKKPTARDSTVVIQETRGAIDSLTAWFRGFLADTPHQDDERCAEAHRLADQVRTLLAEYGAHPEKDASVLESLQDEFDTAMRRISMWCDA